MPNQRGTSPIDRGGGGRSYAAWTGSRSGPGWRRCGHVETFDAERSFPSSGQCSSDGRAAGFKAGVSSPWTGGAVVGRDEVGRGRTGARSGGEEAPVMHTQVPAQEQGCCVAREFMFWSRSKSG